MIDLAVKMMLDEKARFAATVLGVGFAGAWCWCRWGCFSACFKTPASRSTGSARTSGSPRETRRTSISATRSPRLCPAGAIDLRGGESR